MSMAEIQIAPSEHPVIRRWFEGEHLDLIVWESSAGEIIRFRLLSRLLSDEVEGFYWDKFEGLRHGHLPVSHSENDWASLKWVNEFRKPTLGFLEAWKVEGPSLPSLIFRFIETLLEENKLI